MWDRFKYIMMGTVDRPVPWKEKRGNERPKWYKREVMRLSRKKRMAWNR